jgi:hypothetical protein
MWELVPVPGQNLRKRGRWRACDRTIGLAIIGAMHGLSLSRARLRRGVTPKCRQRPAPASGRSFRHALARR